MKSRIFLLTIGLAAICLLGLIGCSGDDNPMNSSGAEQIEPPPPPLPAPKSLTVSTIMLNGFPNTKANGDTWDWDPFDAYNRRPDPYILITTSAGNFWQTDYMANVSSSATTWRTMKISGPKTFDMNTIYTITLYDHDAVGAQKMGSITFRPQGYYNQNPTERVANMHIKGGGLSLGFNGTWNR